MYLPLDGMSGGGWAASGGSDASLAVVYLPLDGMSGGGCAASGGSAASSIPIS